MEKARLSFWNSCERGKSCRISGQIIATASIGSVRSGSTVTATLTAPVKPVPVQNDSCVASENPPLDAWDSGIAEIRAATADRRNLWVAKKYLADKRYWYDKELDSREAAWKKVNDDLETRLNVQKAEETQNRTKALRVADEAFKNSFTAWLKAKEAIESASEDNARTAEAFTNTLDEGKTQFDAAAPTVWKGIKDQFTSIFSWKTMFPGVLIVDSLESKMEHGKQIGEFVGTNGYDNIELNAAVLALAENARMSNLYRGFAGVDPFSLRVISGDQALRDLWNSPVGDAVTAILMYGIAGGFRIKTLGNCFVGDTPIVIGMSDPALALHPPIYATDNSPWAAICILVGVLGSVAVLHDEKRIGRHKKSVNRVPLRPERTDSDLLFEDADAMTLLDDSPASGRVPAQSRPHSPSEEVHKTSPSAFVTQRVTATLVADQDHQPEPTQTNPDSSDSTTEPASRNMQPRRSLLAIGSIISLLFGLWLWSGGNSLDRAITPQVSASAVATSASVGSP